MSTIIRAAVRRAEKGAAGGVATLGPDGMVLPAQFPATGPAGPAGPQGIQGPAGPSGGGSGGVPGTFAASDYGASGSLQTTTGTVASGSTALTVASAVDFAVGQGIAITDGTNWHVTTITAITAISSTAFTLAAAAPAAFSGAMVQHDDSAAIQAAINAALAVNGAVQFGPYEYLCNGNLQNPSTANSVLLIPLNVTSPRKVKALSLLGAATPTMREYGFLPEPGATVLTMTRHKAVTGASILASDAAPGGTEPINRYNFTALFEQRIVYRLAQGNKNIGVNLRYLASVGDAFCAHDVQGVSFGGNASPNTTDMPVPDSASIARLYPREGANAYARSDSLYAIGYGDGVRFGECLQMTGAVIEFCKRAFVGTGAYHINMIDAIIVGCPIVLAADIQSGQPPYVAIDARMSVQLDQNGAWYSRGAAEIVDPSNRLSGRLAYTPVMAQSGIWPTGLALSGATGLRLDNFYNPPSPVVVTPPAPGLVFSSTGPASTADVALWLRADNVVGADGASVAAWPDTGPLAYSAAQATGSLQPVKRTGGAGGQAYVQFSGAQGLALPAFAGLNGKSAATVLLVGNFSGSDAIIFEQGPNFGSTAGSIASTLESGYLTALMGINGSTAVSGAHITATGSSQAMVGTLDFNASQKAQVRGGNNFIDISGAGTVFLTNTLHIGSRAEASAFLTGNIYELLIFNRVLTEAEQVLALSNYLNPRYGLS